MAADYFKQSSCPRQKSNVKSEPSFDFGTLSQLLISFREE